MDNLPERASFSLLTLNLEEHANLSKTYVSLNIILTQEGTV